MKIDDQNYGEQRKIMLSAPKLPTPQRPLRVNELPGPWRWLTADFPNGGRLSRLIDVKGGTVVRVALSSPPVEFVLLEGPSNDISSLAFSPDGKWIAMGTCGQQALLWETATGWIRWNGDAPWGNTPDGSISVAFSPDGRHVLVGGEVAGVAILDAATGKRLRDVCGESSEEGQSGANAVAFSPDGRLIAAALSWQNKPVALIWDSKTGRRVHTLRGPKPPADKFTHVFSSITFSRDGRYVVAGSSDAMAVLFDAVTGKILRQFPSRSGSVTSVALSPDGSKLLTGTDEAETILWDLKSGKQLRAIHCATDEYTYPVWSVAFGPDGRQALAGCGERALLFDVDAGTMLRVFDSSDDADTFAVFSPNGRYVLTAGSRDWWSYREAVLWDAATGKRVQTFQGPKDAIRSLSFTDDGQRLIVDYRHARAVCWDMRTGKPVDEVHQKRTDEDEDRNENLPHEYRSADGRWTVNWAKGGRNTVVLKDARTSKATTILDYALYEPIRVAFDPKSRRIAVADEGSVHVFNPETGKELATFISAYGGREWLVTTPGGYFQGSQGGQSLIRWRVGEAEYSVGRFEKQLYRPDLVAKTLQEKPTP